MNPGVPATDDRVWTDIRICLVTAGGLDSGYQLTHMNLCELAWSLLGKNLGQHRQRILIWAQEYRELGWPP